MSDSLQNRLNRHEETPPPAAWNNIAGRLDKEFSAADIRLSRKLENASVPPPAGLFDKIYAELNSAETEKQPKVVPMFRQRRTAIAAAAAVLLIAASMYFFNNSPEENRNNQTLAGTMVVPAPANSDTVSRPPATQATPDSYATASAPPNTRVRATRKNKPGRIVVSQVNKADENETMIEPALESQMPEAQPVQVSQPIAVSAPPIRDKSGNIIMDLDVISKPGQQYITVTSPNGNQTRLSNKFLDCLRYINANLSSYDTDMNARACKTKFDEWRNKLLAEAAYIPSGDNFFDIFELKELVQEY